MSRFPRWRVGAATIVLAMATGSSAPASLRVPPIVDLVAKGDAPIIVVHVDADAYLPPDAATIQLALVGKPISNTGRLLDLPLPMVPGPTVEVSNQDLQDTVRELIAQGVARESIAPRLVTLQIASDSASKAQAVQIGEILVHLQPVTPRSYLALLSAIGQVQDRRRSQPPYLETVDRFSYRADCAGVLALAKRHAAGVARRQAMLYAKILGVAPMQVVGTTEWDSRGAYGHGADCAVQPPAPTAGGWTSPERLPLADGVFLFGVDHRLSFAYRARAVARAAAGSSLPPVAISEGEYQGAFPQRRLHLDSDVPYISTGARFAVQLNPDVTIVRKRFVGAGAGPSALGALAALRALGVAARDVEVRYDRETGWIVFARVVRSSSQRTNAIWKALGRSGNEVSVAQRFQNCAAVREAIVRAAVSRARRRALAMTDAVGYRLGKVLGILDMSNFFDQVECGFTSTESPSATWARRGPHYHGPRVADIEMAWTIEQEARAPKPADRTGARIFDVAADPTDARSTFWWSLIGRSSEHADAAHALVDAAIDAKIARISIRIPLPGAVEVDSVTRRRLIQAGIPAARIAPREDNSAYGISFAANEAAQLGPTLKILPVALRYGSQVEYLVNDCEGPHLRALALAAQAAVAIARAQARARDLPRFRLRTLIDASSWQGPYATCSGEHELGSSAQGNDAPVPRPLGATVYAGVGRSAGGF